MAVHSRILPEVAVLAVRNLAGIGGRRCATGASATCLVAAGPGVSRP